MCENIYVRDKSDLRLQSHDGMLDIPAFYLEQIVKNIAVLH